jgi:hypothetical protein
MKIDVYDPILGTETRNLHKLGKNPFTTDTYTPYHQTG